MSDEMRMVTRVTTVDARTKLSDVIRPLRRAFCFMPTAVDHTTAPAA
jgi:hypothetical protein